MSKQQGQRQYELISACACVALPITSFCTLPFGALNFGGGAFLIAWLICCAILALPSLILELVQGFSLQAAPPEAIRKCAKRWAWFGWWQSCLGMIALVITTLFASIAWLHCLSFATDGDTISAEPGKLISFIPLGFCGLGLLALTMAFASPGRRTQYALRVRIGSVACLCLVISGVGFLQTPGGSSGFHTFWHIDWSHLSQLEMWFRAAGQALLSALLACGIAPTLASQHIRTSDTTGPASVTVCILVLVQIIVGSISASALGCFSYAAHAGLQAPQALNVLPDVFHISASGMLQSAPLWAIIGFWLGVTLCCFASMHIMVISLRRHIQTRWPMGHQQAGWMVVGLASMLVIPFCHNEIHPWLEALIESWLIYGMFPVIGLSGIFWGWRVKLNGFHDHLTAYSSIRLNDWWPFSISIALPMIIVFIMQAYAIYYAHDMNVLWYIATRILPGLMILNVAFFLGRIAPRQVKP